MAPSQVIEAKDLPPEVLGAAEPAPAGTEPAHAAQPLAAFAPPTAPAADPPALISPTVALPVAAAWMAAPAPATESAWESGLEAEAHTLLATGQTDVWDVLSRRFESRLIQTALASTRGRRIEAAVKLGIGRNTITRKIQELGLD
jgi:two-component system nitrogen regulation response regulator GlnG